MIWEEHTYLMVDWRLVAEEMNSSFVREEAFKHEGNPLFDLKDKALTLGGRAESLVFHLIARDGGRYRLWYQVRGAKKVACEKDSLTAYAESDDGIHFKPVRVGRVVFNGSKNNNLVDFGVPGQPGVRQCGFLHDPLDKEYPYKCVYQRPAKGSEMEAGVIARWPSFKARDWYFVWGIARSRDGFVWEPPAHEHNLIATNPEHAHLHRAMDGGYVLSDQMMNPMAEIGGRNVKGWISYDGVTAHRVPDFLFSLPEHMCRMQAAFGATPWDGTKWVQPHVGLVCARKGPTMLALHGYLYGCTGAETFAQTADIGLAVSATGLGFNEVWPFRPFIPRGPRGAWDFGMTAQHAIIEAGDETRFYYSGGDVGNFASHYLPGLAYIPRDRYGYRMIRGYRNVEKRPARATIALKPITLPEKPALAVNVSHVTPKRTVRIELADESGRAIKGYSFEDCMPVTREGLRRSVTWREGRKARELGGRTVVVRAELSSPDCGVVYFDSPRLYAVYTR